MKTRKIVWLIVFSANILLSHGQTSAIKAKLWQAQLDKMINQTGAGFVNNPEHTGLSIGLIINGSKFTYNYGTIDRKRQLLPDEHTIYEIASVSKSFTGILLAHAILEKRIRLGDDVHQYLIGSYHNLSYKGVPITIGELVNHTSGLPKFIPALNKNLSPEQMMNRYDSLSKQEFLIMLSTVKLDTIPGARFIYSNADAQLIGIILEEIYHASFADILKKYITGPQNMVDTKLDINNLDSTRFAKGYNGKGEIMPRLKWWRKTPAAGYIKSTISDMLKFAKLNLDENDPAISLAHRPISRESAEGADDVGLFWFIKNSGNKERSIYHAGGSFGTTSYIEVRPGQHVGVVLLANDAGSGTEEALKTIAAKILAAIIY